MQFVVHFRTKKAPQTRFIPFFFFFFSIFVDLVDCFNDINLAQMTCHQRAFDTIFLKIADF